MFDGEGRFVTALLRPGKRPSGVEIRGFVRRLIGAIRTHWPKIEFLLCADSHYAAPEVSDWCRANRVDWVFGLAPNPILSRHVAALAKSTAERFKLVSPRGIENFLYSATLGFGFAISQVSGSPGSSSCKTNPASMMALYSSRNAPASACKNSSSER